MTFSFNSLHIRRLSTFKHITIVSVVAYIVYEKLLINIFHTIARHFFPGEINILYLTVEEFFFKFGRNASSSSLPRITNSLQFFRSPSNETRARKKAMRAMRGMRHHPRFESFTCATILTMELVLPDMWWSTFKIDTVMLRSILERAPAKTTVIMCEQKL